MTIRRKYIEIAVGIVVLIIVDVVLVRGLVDETLPVVARIAAAAADILHAGVAREIALGSSRGT
jgi:uncharacterized membrane protein required for colicin V production